MEPSIRQSGAALSFFYFYNLPVCQMPDPAFQAGPGFVRLLRALCCPVRVTG